MNARQTETETMSARQTESEIMSARQTETESMSARQTETGRSPDAVCGTGDVGVDSDANGSADLRLRALMDCRLRQP